MVTYRRSFWPTAPIPQPPAPAAFTLVEMLVAMAITLVMMAAVVTLFANVSNSVRNRRATTEMSGQVRHLRNVLQQDLQGATCPGITWQRPESNHGYIELIEGQYREGNATNLIDANPNASPPQNWPPTELNPEIDHMTSILPSSNLPFADSNWVTDGAGLGDYDDILMLTVRNEHEPFVGRMPSGIHKDNAPNGYLDWNYKTIESTLAEVVWFAIENPGYTDAALTDPKANGFFGEPGMRTVYRRTLLIAPWVNPYTEADEDKDGMFDMGGAEFKAVPGLVRLLPSSEFKQVDVDKVIAAVISFQDRYDLSVRAEWDHTIGHWKIVANTLADLTKRENRFGHFGFFPEDGASKPAHRIYPYPLVSFGSGYAGNNADIEFVPDPEIGEADTDAKAEANIQDAPALQGLVMSYTIEPENYTDERRRYPVRPLAYVDKKPTGVPATVQVMLNDEGQVVRLVHGPVPLWGTRRGEDVMMTDVLAFDLRVYDPGAPLYMETTTQTVLQPSDPGWRTAYSAQLGNAQSGAAFVGQGAYVDLGYAVSNGVPLPVVASGTSWATPWFAEGRALSDVFGNQLAPGFAVYDTWSFHYENNGVNDDADQVKANAMGVLVWQPDDGTGTPLIDEGTNGLDDFGHYLKPNPPPLTEVAIRLGVDDVGERETAPPYDKPLRGVQVMIRTYERDSRAIRQVRVNQHFMPE